MATNPLKKIAAVCEACYTEVLALFPRTEKQPEADLQLIVDAAAMGATDLYGQRDINQAFEDLVERYKFKYSTYDIVRAMFESKLDLDAGSLDLDEVMQQYRERDGATRRGAQLAMRRLFGKERISNWRARHKYGGQRPYL